MLIYLRNTYRSVYMYVSHTHTHTHTHARTHARTHAHTRTHARTNTRTRARARAYIYHKVDLLSTIKEVIIAKTSFFLSFFLFNHTMLI